MSLETDEQSVELSQPREAYEVTVGTTIYRMTSGVRDLVIGGQTFTASPIGRTTLPVTNSSGPGEVTITLPVSHAIPQRYLAQGVPPGTVLVGVLRHQIESGETEYIWRGYATSMTCTGNVAAFSVPARSAQAMLRRLPMITAGRQCPHILYDSRCSVARASFKVTTTVTAVSGRAIRVATMDSKADYWAQFGELHHVASGERMTISDHTGTDITMQLPIVEIGIGDEVEVFAGCAHDVGTCLSKFDNVVNFGGFPDMPTSDIFKPWGAGIYTSE
jgi:uncharacterized phage protein (TIGR02218 family)